MRGLNGDSIIITSIENVARISGEKAVVGKTISMPMTHSLICLMTGSWTVHTRDVKLLCRPGSIIFLPKGVSHRCDKGDNCDGVVVKFTTLDPINTDPFMFLPTKTTRWETLFKSLETAWFHRKPGSLTRCISLLYQAIAMAQETSVRFDLPTTRQASLEKAVNFLKENLKQPNFSVESMAPIAGMCPTYFRQQFRRLYGTSPKQYLLNTRVRIAKDLLATTDMFITNVAKEAGFSSLYYFSKAFKGATGISPRAYRDSVKG
ncbi:MAG: helix-turn-helix domain-containing protein [Oscillospiraceae bacterium]|jgi:AraC-like DNA-binding protein|nr:helix-turn-helix domain-containing protein [Oscillospiraceae bacterium]